MVQSTVQYSPGFVVSPPAKPNSQLLATLLHPNLKLNLTDLLQ